MLQTKGSQRVRQDLATEQQDEDVNGLFSQYRGMLCCLLDKNECTLCTLIDLSNNMQGNVLGTMKRVAKMK